MTTPYTEEALLHFAQVVRTYTGVQLPQISAEAVLEYVKAAYGPEPDGVTNVYGGDPYRIASLSVDYGNV